MLLSVIIPFYQVEKYIAACLDSVVGLPQDEAEIILVDDCGQDSSAVIAAEYAERYPHVRVIRREQNGGLSAARNTGFEAASGEYVYYLDSDDVAFADALLSVARRARKDALDVAKARFLYLEDRTGVRTPGPSIPEMPVCTGGEVFVAESKAGLYEPMVWQCLYRREFIREIGLKMPVGLLFEDELFQAPALLQAKRAAVCPEILLLYRQRAGSIMGSFSKSSEWCFSYMQICRQLGTIANRLPEGEPKAMLRLRIGQIALSTAKNITAYHLLPEAAQKATDFVKSHKKELSDCALRSGNRLVALQGLLLRISPELFLRLYPG